jgi:hypothetical protein
LSFKAKIEGGLGLQTVRSSAFCLLAAVHEMNWASKETNDSLSDAAFSSRHLLNASIPNFFEVAISIRESYL